MTDRLGQGAVSEPEPTDEELRRDKLAEEYARQEEARREGFTRLMRQTIKPILVDATDEETAEKWMDRIWEEVRRNGN